jgi:5-methylthioadenosine/S-adenosylhomocysteine deaminase
MSTPESIHLLIKARWIIPIVPENRVLEDCALAIHDGVIAALLPQAEADKRYRAEQTLDLGEQVLIPGLVNAHGHAAMSLLRGYADDHPLQEWLGQHIWPAEQRWLSEEFVRDGTGLAMAEMIKSGTTCFADMYFYPEQAALAAHQAHMRCQINFPVLDFTTPWSQGAEDALTKGLALRDVPGLVSRLKGWCEEL